MPGTTLPLKEHAMPPDNRNTVGVLPLERSDDQAIMLQRMAQLNQRLLGPWEHADGHMLPRLTLTEAVAQLYEWSTEYRDHPELARDFAVMAARLARRLPSAGARHS
jgi:DNA-binding helix-hairpin-helix protein with protein kinase domain